MEWWWLLIYRNLGQIYNAIPIYDIKVIVGKGNEKINCSKPQKALREQQNKRKFIEFATEEDTKIYYIFNIKKYTKLRR